MDGSLKKNGVIEEVEKRDGLLETGAISSPVNGAYSSGLEVTKAPAHPFISFWRRKQERARYHEVATQPSVFDDASTVASFAPPPTYENAHLFDPGFRWTWGEELPLVARLDLRIAVWSMFVFVVWDMNRSNLSQANTDNFLDDMGMDTNDFNLGNTIFRATAMVAEIPLQLLARKVGVDRFIPVQMFCWSLVSASQFFLNGKKSFLACRFLMALFTGAVIPNIILYMSYFYNSIELPYRLTIFTTGNRVNDIISPLLALGILKMRGTAGREGWRWLFLIEGLLTMVVSLWSWFVMVPSITQTKRRFFSPKGWFNAHEEKILVNRLLRDDPGKSTMHNRETLSPKLFLQALYDYNEWPLYIFTLTARIPMYAPDFYFTLIMRSMGFSTTEANLLTIPPCATYIITCFIAAFLAEKLNQRAYTMAITQFWMMVCLIGMVLLPDDANRWSIYGLYMTILAAPLATGVFAAWISRNSGCVATRSVGATIFGISIQASLLVSANIYREDDKPKYKRGNKALIGIAALNITLALLTKAYYTWSNWRRDRKWAGMSEKEKADHLDTPAEGSKRLDFRFAS